MLDDFPQVEREYEELRDRLARSRGRYDEGLSRLRKDFNLKSLEEAVKALEKKKDERIAATSRYLKKFKRFKRELARAKEKLRDAD